MREINIARVLADKRREKGVTQEELARYMGVSKASVSKWETGQSYPDVTFLPQLAAYFNISIDALLDYQPQMTKEDIRKLYHALAAEFASQPFDAVLARCRDAVKKYYSCFPLLLQMGQLLLNHSAMAVDPSLRTSVLEEAEVLCARVAEESRDASLVPQALSLQAVCRMALGDAPGALALLEGADAPHAPMEALLAQACQMAGDAARAKTALQSGLYQYIMALLGLFPSYFSLYADDPARCQEAWRRACAIIDAFDLERLHPGALLSLYITAAQAFAAQGDAALALDVLERYARLVTGDIYPLRLQGDAFFDLLDGWLAEHDLDIAPPRDEKAIRRDMAAVVIQNPAFAALAEEPRFRRIVKALKDL